MASWEYGHEPPKNDDGSYKSVNGRFGFVIVTPDGTIEDLNGNQIAPSSGSDTDTQVTPVPLTEIGDTNTAVGLQMHVPSGKTLKVYECGVTDDAESAPAGLTIEVQDLTNAATLVSKNALHAEGSPTLASKSGAIDVQIRVANSTSGPVNASGWVRWELE